MNSKVKECDYPKKSFLYEYCLNVFQNKSAPLSRSSQRDIVHLIDNKNIYLNDTKKALELVKQIMDENAFKTTDEKLNDSVFGDDDPEINVLIELYYSKCENEKVNNAFDYHEDDYGGINCKVNTCLIYFDVNCDGGELIFHGENPYEIQRINVNSSLETVKMVICKGDITYQDLDYKNGHKHLLSFQIKRKD
jgi:hypothetical protein